MAITWQNVGAPNVGSGIQAGAIGADMISSGLDRLSTVAGDQHQKNVNNTRADLQNTLLDLTMDPDLGEKQFMSKAISLGKESGLTPDQALAEVGKIKGIYDQASSLTAVQTEKRAQMQQELTSRASYGEEQINLAMKQFDALNPQISQTALDIGAFETQTGGLGEVLATLQSKIEHGDDSADTMAEITKIQEDGGYSDWAVAKSLQELGVEEDYIWDESLLRTKRFKERVQSNEAKFKEAKANTVTRTTRELGMRQAHKENMDNLRNALTEYEKNSRAQNRKDFAGR